jgi:hypothetical protein
MRPHLKWYVSQQSPTHNEELSRIDVLSQVEEALQSDPDTVHVKWRDFPDTEKELVISTAGILEMGKRLAEQVAMSK